MSKAAVVRMLLEIFGKNFKGAAHHPDGAVWMSASTPTRNETTDLMKLTNLRMC